MKAHLLYLAQDFPWDREPLWNEATLVQDLQLDTLYRAMAGGDDYLYEIARKVLPVSLTDVDSILYRQAVLDDCIAHEEVVKAIYSVATDAIEAERHTLYRVFMSTPSGTLHGGSEIADIFVGMLRRLTVITGKHAGGFGSSGFQQFFSAVREELSAEYFDTVQRCLKDLKFPGGTLMSAQLGTGNKGCAYVLRRPHPQDPNLFRRWFGKREPTLTFRIAERDESGARALAELEARGINAVADALAQSVEHIRSFFMMLRDELGFYLGCLNLRRALMEIGSPTCFPVPSVMGARFHRFDAFYDVSLALRTGHPPVANSIDGNGKKLFVVTGANQGGKSTFLRAVGIAQILMQAGMLVGAISFEANVAAAVLTHYKREEDSTMQGGKLDEELKRMSEIADHTVKHALFLSNESFAATNEREGSEIGMQIATALLDRQVKVVLVTHLYSLARGLHDRNMPDALFLRAGRRDDGSRSFTLSENEPLQTSFGEDLYREIFGSEDIDGAPRMLTDSAVPLA